MRLLRRGAAVAALAALLLPTLHPGTARAEELLVMPYTCSIAGGQPVVTPGPEQGHRIIGPREQRKHRACSPVNPEMCRTWTVHRFDLDCEGQRVSWVSLVAATNEGNRRAWLLDGRLLLRMGPRWSLAPDDPCAQDGSEDRPLPSGRLRKRCAERLALAPPAVVEMPFGFAPMLGIDAIFVTGAPAPPSAAKVLPPIIAGAPPAKAAAAETKSPPEPQREPQRDAPREPKASEPKAKVALPTPPVPVPATPPVTPPAPQPAPRVAAPAPPDTTATPPATSEEAAPRKAETEPKAPAPKLATAPASPSTPPVSHGPRIVTVPPPPSTPTVSEVPKKSAPAETAQPSEGNTGPAQKAGSAQRDTALPSPPAKPAPQAKARSEALPSEAESGVGLFALLRPTTTGAIVAFGGLALGLLTAFALARRREHARDAGRRRRDISTMSLDGKSGKTVKAAMRMPPTPAPAQESQPKPAELMGRLALAEVADWSDQLPRTREEALEVLGIGIEPSANATALKKIVDGLRMSWHPDLAKDETDRALREHRSKQINAAWDILQTRRVDA